ncbi:MAG: tRNA epoxyqueuosine(34) reductase QueG [Ignavibacteria bacterium]|nr:MAG: tRNA epoxyqueuosine(34) reductase QueG [Ignavibacteria bacterium]
MAISNDEVIHIAKEKGFDLVGFSKADKLTKEVQKLNKWLAEGFHAGMEYMSRNVEKREDVSLILPGAKSVISLGMNYYLDFNPEIKDGEGKVSRYAWGKDYHLIIWEKLEEIIVELKSKDEDFEAKAYVDTGPVMDKAWAVRSGLGWMGKHSNIINREFGSWFFIANLICNKEFDYSEIKTDHCGTCTACIDSCPTGAIVEDFVIDSNKCISYLTIENKGDIPEKLKDNFGNWAFGCDVCQDVCPWNEKFSQPSRVEDFFDTPNTKLNLEEIEGLSNSKFNRKFATSPIKRARLKGIKRNLNYIGK